MKPLRATGRSSRSGGGAAAGYRGARAGSPPPATSPPAVAPFPVAAHEHEAGARSEIFLAERRRSGARMKVDVDVIAVDADEHIPPLLPVVRPPLLAGATALPVTGGPLPAVVRPVP